MTIWRTRIACWIPKATNTHSEYVIVITFLLQQWLHERTSMLRCMYTACLLMYVVHEKSVLVFKFRIILFWLYKGDSYKSWTALIVYRSLHMEIKFCNGIFMVTPCINNIETLYCPTD